MVANDIQAANSYQTILDTLYNCFKRKVYHRLPADIYKLVFYAISCQQPLEEITSLQRQLGVEGAVDALEAFIKHAIIHGNQETVELFVNYRGVLGGGILGSTLCATLALAVKHGRYDASCLLINKLQQIGLGELLPLVEATFLVAYRSGSLEIVKKLLTLLPQPFSRTIINALGNSSVQSLSCFDYLITVDPTSIGPALYVMVESCNRDLLTHCVNNNININDFEGAQSLLTYALKQKSKLVIDLIDHGANLHYHNHRGLTPSVLALRIRNNAIKHMIAKDPSILDREVGALIRELTQVKMPINAKKDLLNQWLQLRPRLLNQVIEGLTPLMWFCKLQHFELAQFFISMGADVNFNVEQQDGTTRNAMYYAVRVDRNDIPLAQINDNISIVELLLEYDADPNQRINGDTILHWVTSYPESLNPARIIRYLIFFCPHLLNLLDNNHNTALGRAMLAVQPGHHPVTVITLLNLGANPNILVNTPDGLHLSVLYLMCLHNALVAKNYILDGMDATMALHNANTLGTMHVKLLIKDTQERREALYNVQKVINAVNCGDWKYLSCAHRFFHINCSIKNNITEDVRILTDIRTAINDRLIYNAHRFNFSQHQKKVIRAFPILEGGYEYLKKTTSSY